MYHGKFSVPTSFIFYGYLVHSLSGYTVVHLVMAIWDVSVLAITDNAEIFSHVHPCEFVHLCICARSKTALSPWNLVSY